MSILNEFVGLLFDVSSPAGTIFVFVFPWFGVLLYYLFFLTKRVKEVPAAVVEPLTHFLDLLTEGASSGYDKRLMNLFHPDLLAAAVHRGVVRAMARCVCTKLGKPVNIPRDTVLVNYDGENNHIIALVDFEKEQQVKCRMTWRDCAGSKDKPPQRGPLSAEVRQQFHVMAFRIEPHKKINFFTEKFLCAEDFIPFAEKFVEQLFDRPPVAAVEMMHPSLREKHIDSIDKLQRDIQLTCGASADDPVNVNHTLVSAKLMCRPASNDDGASQTEEASVGGIEMIFRVSGVGRRDVDVNLFLTFSGLQCTVACYRVAAVPDTRTQVIVDCETGEKTFIG
ncbi:unnamed protein product [Trypanosoma congolense IL3000]|uniref:WGS project CAEQ00000000 data, annotated contig 389 n=1 Tax=Trypanosoma congolense (strain IL3000) TaxID=1068625 RepID=F9WFI1_TRYCI|nr:unnamed protein product [Trypanosoma congolense IL3000]